MSSSPNSVDWTASKLIPSVIFVITPVVAVGLLVIWSLRIQGMRRYYLATLTGRYPRYPRGQREEGEVDLGERPELEEIWLGLGDEFKENLQGYSRQSSSWDSCLPVSLSRIATGTPSTAENDALGSGDQLRVGMVIRMPSQTPYEEMLHTQSALSNIGIELGSTIVRLR
ncbi:hypothetical protein CPB86DRAFT_785050 [Serendipita vermifera]|nr:hypothetical protein CPB86DRAFT_785050 [Serendipita vermifera]